MKTDCHSILSLDADTTRIMDLLHIFHTIHLPHISQYTTFWQKCAHVCIFLLQNGALWDICLMLSWVCKMGLLKFTLKEGPCLSNTVIAMSISAEAENKSSSKCGGGVVYLSPFYQHWLTSIQAWINNYTPNKVWHEITYPFPNFNDCTVEVWEWINNFNAYCIMDVIAYPWQVLS